MVGSHGPSSGGQIIAIGIIRQATKNKVKALLLLVGVCSSFEVLYFYTWSAMLVSFFLATYIKISVL